MLCGQVESGARVCTAYDEALIRQIVTCGSRWRTERAREDGTLLTVSSWSSSRDREHHRRAMTKLV